MTESNGSRAVAPPSAGKQLMKLALEVGPLVLFFLMNSRYGIFVATQWFMGATVVSLVLSRVLFGRIAVMPLVTAGFVLVFGGLTVWLQDDHFIKLKPTIVNTLFAVILLGGVVLGRPLLRYVFGDIFSLTEEGWRQLTIRWGLFFAFLAIVNEIVWRNFSTDTWVAFKSFGIMPITLIFAFAQLSLIRQHDLAPADAENTARTERLDDAARD